MKKYRLSSISDRSKVDLRDYNDIIVDAVFDVIEEGDEELIISVAKDYYTITPEPSRGDAIRIGKKICKSDLNKYCVTVRKLFCSEDFDPKED